MDDVEEEYVEPTNEQLAKFLVVEARHTPELQHLHLSAPILEALMSQQPEFREAALLKHRRFQDQIKEMTRLMKAGKLQCEHVRPNGKRCPNRNEPGSFYCGLHKEKDGD